jgi:hypothetical protein
VSWDAFDEHNENHRGTVIRGCDFCAEKECACGHSHETHAQGDDMFSTYCHGESCQCGEFDGPKNEVHPARLTVAEQTIDPVTRRTPDEQRRLDAYMDWVSTMPEVRLGRVMP